MFRLKEPDEPTEWPVTVHVPQAGGKTAKHRFTAHFRWLDAEAWQAAAFDGDQALLREVLVGWGEDLRDEHGEPIPFSSEQRDRLARITFVRRAVVTAYGEFIQGRAAGN